MTADYSDYLKQFESTLRDDPSSVLSVLEGLSGLVSTGTLPINDMSSVIAELINYNSILPRYLLAALYNHDKKAFSFVIDELQIMLSDEFTVKDLKKASVTTASIMNSAGPKIEFDKNWPERLAYGKSGDVLATRDNLRVIMAYDTDFSKVFCLDVRNAAKPLSLSYQYADAERVLDGKGTAFPFNPVHADPEVLLGWFFNKKYSLDLSTTLLSSAVKAFEQRKSALETIEKQALSKNSEIKIFNQNWKIKNSTTKTT
jgi:hypothetical protein